MHPHLAYQLAEQHVEDLLKEAAAARLGVRSPRRQPKLRRRAGLRPVAPGRRLGAANAPADR